MASGIFVGEIRTDLYCKECDKWNNYPTENLILLGKDEPWFCPDCLHGVDEYKADFFEDQGIKSRRCWHTYKLYIGLTDKYDYCTKCGNKK